MDRSLTNARIWAEAKLIVDLNVSTRTLAEMFDVDPKTVRNDINIRLRRSNPALAHEASSALSNRNPRIPLFGIAKRCLDCTLRKSTTNELIHIGNRVDYINEGAVSD